MRLYSASWRTVATAALLALLWMPAAGQAMAAMGRHEAMQDTATADTPRGAPEVIQPCVPCLSCPVAPSPAVQSFNQPDGEPRPRGCLQCGVAASSGTCANSDDNPVAALPLRIALCRWLN